MEFWCQNACHARPVIIVIVVGSSANIHLDVRAMRTLDIHAATPLSRSGKEAQEFQFQVPIIDAVQ